MVLDGTLIRTGRCREKTLSVRGQDVDLWYCGKARAHILPAPYAAVAAIPAKQRRYHPPLDISARTRNMLLRSVRCRGERGFALLKGRWRILKRVTASPCKIGDITRATRVFPVGLLAAGQLRAGDLAKRMSPGG